MPYSLSDRLLKNPASLKYLMLAAALMLLFMLGSRDLWTQEWRWANICAGMIYSGDYLHPYLRDQAYYDKPLLSYWLMIALSKISGGLSSWALRLPSALSGIFAVFCVYKIAAQLHNRQTGIIAGWMLITTFYFIFWGRIANADMLNVAGIMLALLLYIQRRERPGFCSYAIFCIILGVTGLLKGLIGVVIPLLAILPDLLKDQRWRQHLRLSLVPAVVPGLILYILPFWASAHFGAQHYAENGLYEVYRENVLRYFQPFDHKGPIYTYFIFLPGYLLPWTLFFIPALFDLRHRWRTLPWSARWMVWSTLIIFIFFTLSGSRRNYYTLPLVPFATLLTAEWIAAGAENFARRYRYAGVMVLTSFILMFLNFGVIQPLYYAGGSRAFGQSVQARATQLRPWQDWQIVFLDAPNKLTFYLNPAKPVQLLSLPEQSSELQQMPRHYTPADLLKSWPLILAPKANMIFVTREMYLDKLTPYFKGYIRVIEPPSLGERWLGKNIQANTAVALIPNRTSNK